MLNKDIPAGVIEPQVGESTYRLHLRGGRYLPETKSTTLEYLQANLPDNQRFMAQLNSDRTHLTQQLEHTNLMLAEGAKRLEWQQYVLNATPLARLVRNQAQAEVVNDGTFRNLYWEQLPIDPEVQVNLFGVPYKPFLIAIQGFIRPGGHVPPHIETGSPEDVEEHFPLVGVAAAQVGNELNFLSGPLSTEELERATLTLMQAARGLLMLATVNNRTEIIPPVVVHKQTRHSAYATIFPDQEEPRYAAVKLRPS